MPRCEQDLQAGGLREQLRGLGSTFASLDRRVEDDVRRRRALEDQRLGEIRGALGRLEDALAAEAVQGEADAQAVQQAMEDLLEDMAARLQEGLLERFGRLASTVELLCGRCSTVERGIRQFKGELPSKLQLESVALKHAINELAEDFEADRRARLDRDGQFRAQAAEAEYRLDSRIQQELAQLERQREALQHLVDEFAGAEEDQEVTSRRATVLEEIAALKAALVEETKARDRSDDQVVQAINQYTATLHRSLCFANT